MAERQPTGKHVSHVKRHGGVARRLGVKGAVVAGLGWEAREGHAHKRAFEQRA